MLMVNTIQIVFFFALKIKYSSQRRDKRLFLTTNCWPPWGYMQTSNCVAKTPNSSTFSSPRSCRNRHLKLEMRCYEFSSTQESLTRFLHISSKIFMINNNLSLNNLNSAIAYTSPFLMRVLAFESVRQTILHRLIPTKFLYLYRKRRW